MATAAFAISCTESGFPEGGTNSGFNTTFVTTQAVGNWTSTVITTVAANMPSIALPSSASAIFLKPVDSTNTFPYRIQPTTSTGVTSAGGGITMSSLGASLLSINPATSLYYLWTTATSAAGGGAPSINIRWGVY